MVGCGRGQTRDVFNERRHSAFFKARNGAPVMCVELMQGQADGLLGPAETTTSVTRLRSSRVAAGLQLDACCRAAVPERGPAWFTHISPSSRTTGIHIISLPALPQLSYSYLSAKSSSQLPHLGSSSRSAAPGLVVYLLERWHNI
jgi:hypothetical protein